MPIKVLPESTINKIAAGEVVERPANAVKELIENSLDAKSTSVEIEIKEAGRKLIRVRDNGSGMAPGEIKLALMRHATSKISSFEDLSALHSMGFRGEALPSIAAVSNLRIQSVTRGAHSGWEALYSAGKLKHEGSWAGAPGTNIEVTDLFFNTPAREKFLKSSQTERGRILKTAEELALAWHGTAFKAVSDGKTALECPRTADPLERIADVLGAGFASTLIMTKAEHPFANITAFLTARESSLPTKNFQFLFVDKRPVNFPRALLHALYEGYRENLPAGRHPGALIFIETDPSEIDVNVHPVKREVRFSKEQQLHGLLASVVRDTLRKAPPPAIKLGGMPDAGRREQAASYSRRSPYETREPSSSASYTRISPELSERLRNAQPAPPELYAEQEQGSGIRTIGQAFNLYIVLQDGQDLMIVDQHAAAERVRYEKYLSQWHTGKIAVQPLLFPENIELAASIFSHASGATGLLKEAGWDVEEFGPHTLRVSSVPSVLGSGASISSMLALIFEALSEERKLPGKDKIEKIIRAACRASIKAGDTVSGPEADKLIEDLMKCETPNTCPHGRPTMLKISKRELARHFSRG